MTKNKQTLTTQSQQLARRIVVLSTLISMVGCATSAPKYLPAPSAKKTVNDYKREQIASPEGKQLASSFVSGFIGGVMGPFGAIFSVISASYADKKILVNHWKSFSNTELVGVVIEDVTQKRLLDYKNNAKTFTNLPTEANMPKHYTVDLGAGNLFVLPVKAGIHTHVGDVVTVYAPPDTWKLVEGKANFHYMPTIINVRCLATDQACIKAPDNEQGIAKHLGEPNEA
jgi:predicted small lipoprotein YifL